MVDINVLKSEWSFAECKVADVNVPAICCFGPNSSHIVRVFVATGVYLELTFDLQKGGEPLTIATYDCKPFIHGNNKPDSTTVDE